MLKFTPLLLAIVYGIVAWHFSAWRLRGELNRRSSALDDPHLLQMAARMARALDLPRIRVNIYEIPTINGLAAPDGRIFLTRGFHAAYERGEVTAEELASVIAHELGHVALGHTRRRMIDFSGQNALRAGLAMVFARLIPGIGPMIAGLLTSLLAARLSRADEYEADAYAAALLSKAGIGVAPQISLFRKLDQMAGGGASARPGSAAWLASHPRTQDRIAAIEALDAKWHRSA